jgi:hypothetical protein
MKPLKQGLMGMAVTSNDRAFTDRMLAHIFLALIPTESQPVPLPIMTGTIMDRMWEELEAAKEGYTEGSFFLRLP